MEPNSFIVHLGREIITQKNLCFYISKRELSCGSSQVVMKIDIFSILRFASSLHTSWSESLTLPRVNRDRCVLTCSTSYDDTHNKSKIIIFTSLFVSHLRISSWDHEWNTGKAKEILSLSIIYTIPEEIKWERDGTFLFVCLFAFEKISERLWTWKNISPNAISTHKISNMKIFVQKCARVYRDREWIFCNFVFNLQNVELM